MLTYPNFVEVTHVGLRELVRRAYRLSKPQGYGYLHFVPGEISNSMIDTLLDETFYRPKGVAVSMDYVLGRAVKLTIYEQDGKLFMLENWFDHTEEAKKVLIA